jgi:hypothetical protein
MLSRKETAAVVIHADSPTSFKDHNDNNNNKCRSLMNYPHSERAETFGRPARVAILTASSSMEASMLDKAPAKVSKRVCIAPTFFQM